MAHFRSLNWRGGHFLWTSSNSTGTKYKRGLIYDTMKLSKITRWRRQIITTFVIDSSVCLTTTHTPLIFDPISKYKKKRKHKLPPSHPQNFNTLLSYKLDLRTASIWTKSYITYIHRLPLPKSWPYKNKSIPQSNTKPAPRSKRGIGRQSSN